MPPDPRVKEVVLVSGNQMGDGRCGDPKLTGLTALLAAGGCSQLPPRVPMAMGVLGAANRDWQRVK